MFESFDTMTWLLLLVVVGLVAITLSLVALPLVGVNVADYLKKLSEDTEVLEQKEDETGYKITPLNSLYGQIVYDPQQNREEQILWYANEGRNGITLFYKNDNDKPVPFTKIERPEMIKPADPLRAIESGIITNWIIDRDDVYSKQQQIIQSLRFKVASLQKELKELTTKTTKDIIIDEGEKMHEVKKAIYGNSSPFSPFSADRWGFGRSRYSPPEEPEY